MNRKDHWNQVYKESALDDVSWFQARPAISLDLIEAAGVAKDAPILDVGAGASLLVDCLLDLRFDRIAVLDLSAAALDQARQRLGERAKAVEWFEADVTEFVPAHRFSLWHDRAAFHFLTDPIDQAKYVETLKRALTPDGHAIIGTFAVDGPLQCSGLDVARYDAPLLGAVLGQEFRLVEQRDEVHVTPWGSEQRFSFFRLVRKGD
jgi:SAM-dependent methyltransferase